MMPPNNEPISNINEEVGISIQRYISGEEARTSERLYQRTDKVMRSGLVKITF